MTEFIWPSKEEDDRRQAEHERLQAEARVPFTPTEGQSFPPHCLSYCWCCCEDCDPRMAAQMASIEKEPTEDEFARLLEQSSLGTPNARAIQALNTEEKEPTEVGPLLEEARRTNARAIARLSDTEEKKTSDD